MAFVRAVDGDAASFGIHVGSGLPLEDTYSARIVDGDLPGLVRDARSDPRAAALPMTDAADIGAYLGVPVRLGDGQLYGMVTCLAHAPQPGLGERDLAFVEEMTRLLAQQLERESSGGEGARDELDRIRRLIDRRELTVVFQPIYDLQAQTLVGLEALARFDFSPRRPPTAWFEAAAALGISLELELLAVQVALELLDRLPPTASLALNVSPGVAASQELYEIVAPVAHRLVIEITEHAPVEDYAELDAALARLRERGARLAIDDVGAGFANLRHVLHLAPDILKLDLSLTNDIDIDPSRRALASSLLTFARGINAQVTAEGIESPAALRQLRNLGIDYGQGYYLGRPRSLVDVLNDGFSLN
jgi:EAL domain-containing protein (putative c-di-GMP-specific phosphodiesterase class I)